MNEKLVFENSLCSQIQRKINHMYIILHTPIYPIYE